MKFTPRFVLISSALIAVITGLTILISKNKGLIYWEKICIQKPEIQCGPIFSVRYLKNAGWKETYEDGFLIRGFVQTYFGIPFWWWVQVDQAGDDWSSTLESHWQNVIKKEGRSEALGRFHSQLIHENQSWKMKIDLLEHSNEILLNEAGFQPW